MNKRNLWLTVSCVMVLSLILAFSAPATSAKEMMRNFQGKEVEKPTYGGTLNVIWPHKIHYWDEARGHAYFSTGLVQTNASLFIGDWRKGALGTREAKYAYYVYDHDRQTPHLAESYKIPDSNTMIFKIRKGVHFHNKPPVNGRELDANDVAFTLKRLWTSPKCAHALSYAWKKNIQELDGGPHIIATDKWTVEIKTLPGKQGLVWEWAMGHSYIIPHEVIEKYGNMEDWKNVVGTGPFMLVDYVEGSAATYVKNPNYWMTDPVHPGMKLPYVDKLKLLEIPEMSTRLAAMRAGKADIMHPWGSGLTWDEIKTLKKTNPELKVCELPATNPSAIFGRIDKKPFDDVRVRRALSMAIDRQGIAKSLYEGHAMTFGFPILPIGEFSDVFRPISEYPESTQQWYKYDPEKAKKLLAEAGYPKGFKTRVLSDNVPNDVNLAQIVKEYFAQIGVEMDIDIKERGVYRSMLKEKSYPQMIMGSWHPTAYHKFVRLMPGQIWNFAVVDDPKITETRNAMAVAYWDRPKRNKIYKDFSPYLLDQVYGMEIATSNMFGLWQPSLGGYNGEVEVGYASCLGNYAMFVWKDKK